MAETDNNINGQHVDGDLSVGRNVTVGGREIVRGNMQVDHNLKVKGYLEAAGIKGTNKGVYESVEALRGAYPNPEEGWYAFVATAVWNVAVVSEDATKGVVMGGGACPVGESIGVEAMPNAGYSFSHWSDGSTVTPRTFTPSADANLVAYFNQNLTI